MESKPDFFLTAAGENEDLTSPRACWVLKRLKDVNRSDHTLIRIDPPVVGQKYGLGNQNITELLISPRYQGTSLAPISEWPCHVYISRVLDSLVRETLFIRSDQIKIVAWGIIFHSLAEAEAQAARFQQCH